MKTKRTNQVCRLVWLTLMLFLTTATFAFSQQTSETPQAPPPQGEQEAVLVGRISHVEGQLLRYVSAEKDWVATVKDAPFGLEDALYSDEKSKAEFIMPNNTWVRTGGSTQIQMIRLENDLTEMDVASGMARFFNKSSNGVIKATTPFGYVLAGPLATFDLYVGDKSVEVIALKEKVDFVHPSGNTEHEVVAGSSSILADGQQIGSGAGNPDAEWDGWNDGRDSLWTTRLQVSGDSKRYLPPVLHDEAYALEENGRWERVNYEGDDRYFWRPTRVRPGWAPFTMGRWTDWYGDNCWIPDEPFGYVTHHYGNWVYANNFWFWAPPVVRVRIGLPLPPLPLLPIPFGWFPGRVSWIHSNLFVGWVPLAPFEPYYCHRRWGWGPHSFVWDHYHPVHLDIRHYRYLDHAVMVHQHNFYGVNNYNNVRITNINRTTIINNYRIEPVVSDRVIHNYTTNRQKYNFTDIGVIKKPHQTVLQRIERNQRIAIDRGIKPPRPDEPTAPVQRDRGIKPPRPDEPTAPVKPEPNIRSHRPEGSGIVQEGKPEKPEGPGAPRERIIPPARPGQPREIQPEQPVRLRKIPSPRPEQPATMQPVGPERPGVERPGHREAPEKPGAHREKFTPPARPAQPERIEREKPTRHGPGTPEQKATGRESRLQYSPQGQPAHREQMERNTQRQRPTKFDQQSRVRPQERQLRSDSHSQSRSVRGEQPHRVQLQARSEKTDRSNYKD